MKIKKEGFLENSNTIFAFEKRNLLLLRNKEMSPSTMALSDVSANRIS